MDEALRMNFAGDVCLDGIAVDEYEIDERLIRRFKDADLNVANLESSLTSADSPTPGQPVYLKAKPRANPITDLFNVFSLANNHILDFKEPGLNETIGFLSQQGKHWFGAGANKQRAYQPLRLERRGFRAAFLGCTRWYNATSKDCGTTPENVRRLAAIIRKLKSEDYFVTVCPHWNYEHVVYPSPIERKRAMKLIDAGADLIVGTHPHTVQGYETYRGKYIFHSLGNFAFHSSIFNPRQDGLFQTFLLSVNIQRDHTYSTNLIPVRTGDHGIRPMNQTEEERFTERLRQLSAIFGDEKLFRRLFYENSREIISHTMGSLRSTSSRRNALSALIRRLPRVQRQDVYIKLHSMFRK